MNKDELLKLLAAATTDEEREDAAAAILALHEGEVKKVKAAKKGRTANLDNRAKRVAEITKALATATSVEEVDAIELGDNNDMKEAAAALKARFAADEKVKTELATVTEFITAQKQQAEMAQVTTALSDHLQAVNPDMRGTITERIMPHVKFDAAGQPFVHDGKGAQRMTGDGKPFAVDALFEDVRNGGFTGPALPSAFAPLHTGNMVGDTFTKPAAPSQASADSYEQAAASYTVF
jgi:hypothetical protein